MSTVYTQEDFEGVSWHDCRIWGIEFRVGDIDEDDWTSDLAFDIDFIVEWLRETGRGYQFRVSPATLVFHGVTEPRITIDNARSGFQVSLYPTSISHIERERILDQKVHLDRPYYKWKICLNSDEGEISFGATGFTQTLRAEPVLTHSQFLYLKERSRPASR